MAELTEWEALKAEIVNTPELRAAFERERDHVIFVRRLLFAIA